jgi:6-pyruvoyltetrahydropterin/6-carboxytetrahydropterin synthase
MYTLSLKRDFIATHFLIGGDWGPENFPNSHHYVLDLQLSGESLDQHGYLVDLVEVEKKLNELVAHYRQKTLNELPEFSGLNPSLENFVRILATTLNVRIPAENIHTVRAVLWENENTWASFSLSR